MAWYYRVRTIKGRQYSYRQRTYREGGKVHTEVDLSRPGRCTRAEEKVDRRPRDGGDNQGHRPLACLSGRRNAAAWLFKIHARRSNVPPTSLGILQWETSPSGTGTEHTR